MTKDNPTFPLKTEILDYDIDEAQKEVEDLLQRRLKSGAIKTLNDETQFLTGAMCVFNTLFGNGKTIPSFISTRWVFNGLSGESIIEKQEYK